MPDLPLLISTIHGPMPEDRLERRDTIHEDENEIAKAVEYWMDGELVHRSVHVHLKRAVFAGGFSANFA